MSVEEYDALKRGFGSVGTAALGMWMCVSGGIDWKDYYDLVIPLGAGNIVLFILLIFLFTVAIWNILTSTFVEKALKLAQPDIDTLMYEKRQHDLNDRRELEEFFEQYDTDGSKTLTQDELKHLLRNADVGSFLEVHGIDIKEVSKFFKMLVSVEGNDQAMPLRKFADSCIRLKGVATSVDLHTLKFENTLLFRSLLEILQDLSQRVEELHLSITTRGEGTKSL